MWPFNKYFIDPRDSKKYKIKSIGNQVWMVENLAFNIGVDGCCYFQDDAKNYKKYGMLYNWPGAMLSCPVGWRIPSRKDFELLFQNIGGSNKDVIKSLKKSGFNNLFDGWKGYDRYFHKPLGGVKFWTSTNLNDTAEFVNINSGSSLSYIGEIKGDFFTVCCIKN
jgi:uncharacterized protein (TIGR02145 family)